MSIVNELIRIRKEKKVNQKEMAKKLNISIGSLCRFEKGNRKMDINTVENYANNLDYELRLLRK